MRLIQRVDEKLTKASLEEKLEKYSVYLHCLLITFQTLHQHIH